MTERPRLGFIGIGIMGEAMTLRLLERGWKVRIWNLTPDRYAKVLPAGAIEMSSPAAVAAASDIVLMCVLDANAVRNCVFGEQGLASASGSGAIVIDHSTINPDVTREVAGKLRAANGMRWIDAPVSGGPLFARDGTLTVMAGGDSADIAAIASVMTDLAGSFTHVGSLGAGQTAKILNQAIVGTGYVLMAEALALAEAAGLEAAKVPQCLSGGFADSMLLQKIYPQMAARDFEPPRGYARQLLKDMKNVKGFAHAAGLELPLLETAVERYARYVESGNEMADAASISRLYERKRMP
ncbi:MAG TPA: NAD(P)-dependent oxidoreductase [Stellaceae bacterium]|nr:NAD(P)-dependent oxidoreductase [Stellaceae bacterium]